MSRIRVHIDHVVMKGFDPADRKAILQGLEAELTRVLANPAARAQWASQSKPVLRLGTMPWQGGVTGSRKFGAGVARAIGRGLK